MNKIVSSLIVGIMMLVATPAIAGGRHDHRWGVDANRHSPYHNMHHHHRHGKLNSTEKVIIGAIIGGVIVDAVHRNRTVEPAPVIVRPLPEPYVAQTCTTREVYDQYNRLITRERFCN